jgi:hypothetical protein
LPSAVPSWQAGLAVYCSKPLMSADLPELGWAAACEWRWLFGKP